MKNKTTYALLMRSEEKGRDLLETTVYAFCVLSAVFAIWEFAQQPVTLMGDGSSFQPAPPISHHQAQSIPTRKS